MPVPDEPERTSLNEKALRPPSGFTAEQISRKIGHELGSQLTGSAGLLDLLLDSELNNQQRSFIESIKSSNMTMIFMVNGLHDMIRLEDGTFEANRGITKLSKIFKDLEFLFTPIAEERGLSIEFSLSDAIPGALFGDSRRLGIILYHLLCNAIQYSHSGNITISAGIHGKGFNPGSSNPFEIAFEVKDEGEGISDSDLKAFLSQESLSNTLTHDKGLGLITCKKIISNLKGRISIIRPENKRGTTVRFILPFSSSLSDQHLFDPDYQVKKPQQQQPRILVADDDPVNRKFVTKLLEKKGMQPHAVADGDEALKAFGDEVYDLLLIDCQMPIRDGFSTVLETRKLEGRTSPDSRIPIIMWSATNSEDEKEQALQSGADEFILKPIDAQFLVEKIIGRLGWFSHDGSPHPV